MKKEEILKIIRSLAANQILYNKLFILLSSDEPDAVAYLEYLEKQNFRDIVDLILFIGI